MATPKKLVHWALNASLSDLGSPFSEASSSDSYSSASSLEYINSQLISHGFVHDSGLSFDGLAKEDADRVVKCILGMLGQWIDDMSRTEALSAKLRTLSYDHERLTSMHKSEAEKAANAEREMNLHKTRMTAATKSLQSCENAHKHTTAELQRTRSTLHSLRAAHQTEIKKLEKEKERMVERWSKVSDGQLKIGSLAAGLTCVNLDVVEASDVQLRGKGQGFLDVALEQAESARKDLFDQNRKLRDLLLSTANELQRLLHAARTAGESEYRDEPNPLSINALFADAPTETAGDTLNALFASLRDTVSRKADGPIPLSCSCPPSRVSSSSSPTNCSKVPDSAEINHLQSVIDKLRRELDQAQKQAAASAAQTQELFDRFAEEQRLASREIPDLSVDLMTAPAQDEEKRRLDERFKELEDERRQFTEAAVRLGREKAVLEAERLKFLEEKRSWEVEMMLAELPPTPAPAAAAGPSSSRTPALSSIPAAMLPPRSSPRRSSRKSKAKGTNVRKTRVSRRSSVLSAIALSPQGKTKVQPSYETEVIPSTIPSIPPSPSRPPPEFKTSMEAPSPPPTAFLSSTFMLPPPSPAASLPRDGVQTKLPPIPPLPKFEIPSTLDTSDDDIMDVTPESLPSTSTSTASATSSSIPSSSSNASSSSALVQPSAPVPSTPVVRPFPMAKPFAQRMIHAYSPVKPSPLSRILMMADSPESPESPRLDALAEVDENARATDATLGSQEPMPIRSLAEELGVSEDDDSPLREKPAPVKHAGTITTRRTAAAAAKDEREKEKGRGKDKAQGKGKARAEAAPAPPPQQRTSRARPGATLEKENVKRAKLSNPPTGSGGGSTRSTRSADSNSGSGSRETKKAAGSGGKPVGIGARARAAGAGAVAAKGAPLKPALKGGPRRVPVGSAEAATVPTWRG